jgi:hypothetical protein
MSAGDPWRTPEHELYEMTVSQAFLGAVKSAKRLAWTMSRARL